MVRNHYFACHGKKALNYFSKVSEQQKKRFSFQHQAMATQYTLTIVHTDNRAAEWAAKCCFKRLETLELNLSRFVPDSDISRINGLKQGEELLLDHETWEAIKQGITVHQWTQGSFDIGVAEHMDIFRAAKQGVLNSHETYRALEMAQREKEQGRMFVDPTAPRIRCEREGIKLDLGGLGKGYALDELAKMLSEHAMADFCLSAGDSSVAAIGGDENGHPWSYLLTTETEQRSVEVDGLFVSATGTFYQGQHIFDPRIGKNKDVSSYDRIWVASKKGAYSDAFSTGLFLLEPEVIKTVAVQLADIEWVAVSENGEIWTVP